MITISEIKESLRGRRAFAERLGNIYETTREYPGSGWDQVIEFDGPGCLKLRGNEIFVDCDGVWNQDPLKSLEAAISWIEKEYRKWNI